VHDDLVQRQFAATCPDAIRLTDITEHPAVEGKLYCCAIRDVFSNRIVRYALNELMTAQLARTALLSGDRPPPPRGTVGVLPLTMLVHAGSCAGMLILRGQGTGTTAKLKPMD
jgi:putative transposase